MGHKSHKRVAIIKLFIITNMFRLCHFTFFILLSIPVFLQLCLIRPLLAVLRDPFIYYLWT